jgi:type IV pilus assembly protein PilQ
MFTALASGVYSVEKSGVMANKIIDLKVSNKDGVTKVAIIGNGEISRHYRYFQLSNPHRLSVDFSEMTSGLDKRLFEINGKELKRIRVGECNDRVRIVFDFQGTEVPSFEFKDEKNSLVVIFDEISRGKKEAVSETTPHTIAEVKKPPPQKVDPKAKPRGGIHPVREISLDFHKADIHNVFRIIAEVANKEGINFVISDKVEGKVTVKLEKVPWDMALDVILKNNKLGKARIGKNIIWIATRGEIEAEEKSRKEKEIAERKEKEVLAPLTTSIVPVNFADVGDLTGQIEKLLTPERGSVSTDNRTNSLIIKDVVTNIEEIKKFVKKLDTPTPQVLIEARVVQFNPSYLRDIGIRWDASYNDNAAGEKGSLELDTISGGAGELGASFGNLAFGYLSRNVDLDVKLTALEKEDKAEIISRPRIMTLDNKEAVIEQGVDLPYLKLSEQGVTSTEFKKATLELKVKPHITPDGSVVMVVSIKKDQKSAVTGGGGEPGIDTKSAETEVLVKSGETVVIGGIIEENETETVQRVPFFGKIPLLGWLFTKKFKEIIKTDLTIFITPTIVRGEATATS